MRRYYLLALAALLSTTGYPQQPSPVVQYRLPELQASPAACPIGFTARASGTAVMVQTKDGRGKESAHSVALQFKSNDTRRVESATVTIHGIRQTNLYLKTRGATQANISRTFYLHPNVGSDGLAQDQVSVAGITTLRSAEITEMRYSDGTVWHPSKLSACQAAISGFRLINTPVK
ncbi:hypothetical protein AB4Y89_20440 [Terriglobus sp. 2YAB30_2]|uniref:hypothetical protein n=1 Tax=unclassified Terriglobus TaxID=2628988 RepID=UPI003F95A0A2